jgi:hypothetical protein
MRRSETGVSTSIRHISRIECWGSSVAVKKTMKAICFHRRFFLFMTCAVPMIPLTVSRASAQTGIVTADGATIIEDEIEQRSRLHVPATHKRPERQDVIDKLADEKRGNQGLRNMMSVRPPPMSRMPMCRCAHACTLHRSS